MQVILSVIILRVIYLLARRVNVAVANNSSVASFIFGIPGNSAIICFRYSVMMFWVESTVRFVNGLFRVPTSNKPIIWSIISWKWWMHLWCFFSAALTRVKTTPSVLFSSIDWIWHSFSVSQLSGPYQQQSTWPRRLSSRRKSKLISSRVFWSLHGFSLIYRESINTLLQSYL